MSEPGAASATADERSLQAAELLDRNRIAMARDVLREALEVEPEHAGLLFQAARADALSSDTNGAIETLRRLLARDPGHVDARFLLLALLTSTGELAEAESLSLELIAEYPEAPALYAAYARVMLQALQFAKGRELAAEALRRDPDSGAALRVMALCDIVEGRGDDAALRRLIAEHPDDEQTLSTLAVALIHRNRPAEALRCAQALLRASPSDPSRLRLVRELRYQRHWSMVPLRPLQRWGWGASIGLWVAAVMATRALAPSQPELANLLGWTVFLYAIYSWTWPWLLRKLLKLDRDDA